MNESKFLLICIILFFCSFAALSFFVISSKTADFKVDEYTSVIECVSGACSFTGKIVAVAASSTNETLFYKLEKPSVVDAVFFIGNKKPTFAVGDCVNVRGVAQDYKGKQSIVLSYIKKSNCTS